MSRPSDLIQGTLDGLILSIVSSEPLHGLAIFERLRVRSGDALRVSHGALYPALHKLEHNGFLRATWRRTESGRRAKYYALTRSGARRLRQESEDWERLSAAISMVFRPV